MAPLPVVPNVLKIRHVFTLGTDTTAQVGLHYAYTGTAPSNATCLAIATAARAAAVTNLVPLLCTENTFTDVEVTDLSVTSGGQGTDTGSNGGGRSGSALAAGTAVLNSETIARRYRGGKPRSYWPFGVASDLLNADTWESASVTAFLSGLDVYNGAVSAISTGGTTLTGPVNVSYYSGFTAVENPVTHRWRNIPTVRTGAIPVDTILAYTISPRPASQRRRNQQRR